MPAIARYKSDPSVVARICEAIRGGASRFQAAKAVNISIETFERWIDATDGIVRNAIETAELDARSRGTRPMALDKPSKKVKTADPWERARAEAAALGDGIFGFLLWADAKLQAKGFPPLSPWWVEQLRAFYASGKRWCALMVGRGGGKSTSLCRVAVVEALFADRVLPPGEAWVWPFMSVSKGEAKKRLRTIVAILSALGVDYHESSPEGRPTVAFSDAKGQPIEFSVFAATVRGISGPSGCGATCDEESKWQDDDTGANPAREVLASLRPIFRGRAGIHGFRCSSAWLRSGTHYDTVSAGDDDLHYVGKLGSFVAQAREGLERVAASEKTPEAAALIRAHAATLTEDSAEIPTWIANPTIDAAATRADEPNVRTWLREYASVPSDQIEGSFFDATLLAACAEYELEMGDGERFAGIDTGSKRNSAALAVVERVETEAGYRWRPVLLREWAPSAGAPLDLDRVVLPAMAYLTRKAGAATWVSDAYYSTSVELRAAEHDITVTFVGGDPFNESYRAVRDGIHRCHVSLAGEENAEAVRQLGMVRSIPGERGHTKIVIPHEGDGHGDVGSALVRALAAAGCGAEELDSEAFTFDRSRYAQ